MTDILSAILEGLGKILVSAITQTQKKADNINNEVDRVKQRADSYSDEKLKERYQNTSSLIEKKAYSDILKDRQNKDK